MNTLFSNLEMKTSLSLGRKIAHASSESEEFLVSLQEDAPRERTHENGNISQKEDYVGA